MVAKPTIYTANKLWAHINRWGRNSPAYIVIHFTAGFYPDSDSDAGMLSTYKSYLEYGSNAHYLVGRNAIWEMVDPKTHYCGYSCGSPVGKINQCKIPGWFGGPLAMSHAGIAGHSNTINIEICSCKTGNKKCDPLDDGWYFNDSTYMNAVMLTAWLCDEFSIRVDHIIMHNQVTGKLCPAMWCSPTGNENGLEQFRQSVSLLLNDIVEDTPIISPSPKPESGTIQVDTGMLFYSRSKDDSVIVGQADSVMDMPYTVKSNGFYYTDMGWVKV